VSAEVKGNSLVAGFFVFLGPGGDVSLSVVQGLVCFFLWFLFVELLGFGGFGFEWDGLMGFSKFRFVYMGWFVRE